MIIYCRLFTVSTIVLAIWASPTIADDTDAPLLNFTEIPPPPHASELSAPFAPLLENNQAIESTTTYAYDPNGGLHLRGGFSPPGIGGKLQCLKFEEERVDNGSQPEISFYYVEDTDALAVATGFDIRGEASALETKGKVKASSGYSGLFKKRSAVVVVRAAVNFGRWQLKGLPKLQPDIPDSYISDPVSFRDKCVLWSGVEVLSQRLFLWTRSLLN
jgi:hypothetical protein